ncbi:arginine--tRNA ligase [Salipaludibacillus daqingensis]|uniref:arginine--tRNA ligase n=1 Tax=Salipaludibacillus daqingensis TaxID=3041001 RepID=UPI002473CD61|nr:arginine--tRNA ligase [Salipaludibacillus daqingensis]
MKVKEEVAKRLEEKLQGELERRKILLMLEKPKYADMGDLAFPCFELAKVFRKSPQNIACELAGKIKDPIIEKIEAVSGYVNVFLNKKMVANEVVSGVIELNENYGSINIGNAETMIIDFSSPNIAKPFSMGHLRSTVIGQSLSLIAEKCGYKTVKINHIGDWGTQFGKLIVAYRLWGNEAKVKKDPIKELLKLYVQFHEEAEQNSTLNDQGREWFKKLEHGNEEALGLWKWFREESLSEFEKIYEELGITFDSYHGEAFYNDKMQPIVDLMEEKGILEESEGAQVVPLAGMPPCLIKKRDGSTLYATRDLAAALYRQETYGFSKSLYVVGNEQSLHFQQLFAVLKEMGYNWYEGMSHISFGMMLKDGKKMSTRKGKVVLLDEVIQEAVSLALKNINEKNPSLENKDNVARQVGTGAIIFHDLKHHRQHDIEFSLDDMLRFEGETGPYVQYTHARASSLLVKGQFNKTDEVEVVDDELAWPVVTQLMAFPEVVKRSFHTYDPSQIAKHVVELSRAFNQYYGAVRVLDDPIHKQARLTLVYSVKVVLKEGLRLLGLKAPEKM